MVPNVALGNSYSRSVRTIKKGPAIPHLLLVVPNNNFRMLPQLSTASAY